VVRTAQHLKAAQPVLVGVEVVVATRAVATAVARRLVVHFAVASLRSAARLLAVILRASLCRGTSESPDVVALPRTTAGVATPRASSGGVDARVAPLAHARVAAPGRKGTRDALSFERAHLAVWRAAR